MKDNDYKNAPQYRLNHPNYSNMPFENLLSRLPLRQEDPGRFDQLLGDLQGNILKHHNRDHSMFYFIHFLKNKDGLEKALKWIRKELYENVTPAIAQLTDKDHAQPVVGFYLTWKGYERLGLEHIAPFPGDFTAFQKGMTGRIPIENNPSDQLLAPVDEMDEPQDIHALLMIADHDKDRLAPEWIKKLTDGDWAHVSSQKGIMKRMKPDTVSGKEPARGKAVEWFGFRDGISQPLFFPDLRGRNQFHEDDLSPLRTVLVKEKWTGSYSAGSFLVFLKIEQNVRQFLRNASEVAEKINEKDPELAAAYLVGRYRDGTPVTLYSDAGTGRPDGQNDFVYSKIHISNDRSNVSDREGIRCPFAAHIRKANPRLGTESRLLVRQGVLYDDRKGASDDPAYQTPTLEDAPDKDVGMLFMSFQASIEDQFEYMLKNWILSINTGLQATGVDLLLGTGMDHDLSNWYLPKSWGNEDPDSRIRLTSREIRPCTRLLAGEYFFAPSRSCLKKALDNSLALNTYWRRPNSPEPEPAARGIEGQGTEKEKISEQGGYIIPQLIRRK